MHKHTWKFMATYVHNKSSASLNACQGTRQSVHYFQNLEFLLVTRSLYKQKFWAAEKIDLVWFLHWRLFEQVMFVCLFVCVGGHVGDGEQDGSSTNCPRKCSKGKPAIHFGSKTL